MELICPKCKSTFEENTQFCITDGTKLVKKQNLIPRCEICKTSYQNGIKFCPKDGGKIKIEFVKSITLEINDKIVNYKLASFKERFLARLFDTLIVGIFFIPIFPAWLYYSILQSGKLQATIGQRALGIKVVSISKNNVSFGQATGRFFAYFLNIVTFGYGFLKFFYSDNSQCLHDDLSNILVVKSELPRIKLPPFLIIIVCILLVLIGGLNLLEFTDIFYDPIKWITNFSLLFVVIGLIKMKKWANHLYAIILILHFINFLIYFLLDKEPNGDFFWTSVLHILFLIICYSQIKKMD